MNQKIQSLPELRLCVLQGASEPGGYSGRWHSHSFHEVGIVLEGECVWQIPGRRDRRLRSGDFIWIPPHCLHREETRRRVRLGWVGFASSLCAPSRHSMRAIPGGADAPVIRHLLEHLYGEQNRTGSAGLCLLTLQHLLLLFHRAAGKPAARRPASHDLNPRQVRIVESLTAYLDRNASSPMSLNQVAEYHRLSAAHLSELFQRYHRITPTRYRLNRRIGHARHLLATQAGSIKEIAAACGFADAAHFCREFRRHTGSSPGQARAGGAP